MNGPDDRDPVANYALLLVAWYRLRGRNEFAPEWVDLMEAADHARLAHIDRHIARCRQLVARRRCDGCYWWEEAGEECGHHGKRLCYADWHCADWRPAG